MPLPKLQLKARTLARRQKIMRLVGECRPVVEIAREMELDVRSIRRHLSKALESESLYPNGLDSERIGELRQIEAERLTKLWQKTQMTIDQVQPRIGTDGERGLDATSVARLIVAGTQVSDQISKLFGLLAPTKVIEQQLLVSYRKTENKVTICFDRSPIEALARQPVPGLTITANGTGNALALDSGASMVALDRLDVREPESAPVANQGSAPNPEVNVSTSDATD